MDNMRFAIATIDRYLGVFENFVHAGWKPLKLFTVPTSVELANQQAVIAYAQQYKAAIQISPMTEHDLQALKSQGCETLIVASYDWIIPDWRNILDHAVNFHSSPLPHGRGPYPAVRAILENWDHWAITCHKLSPEIDGGDILAAEKFPLQSDECHESIDLKIQMAARTLAKRVAAHFSELWTEATPQTDGSYWPRFKMKQRIVDFSKPVKEILHFIRAFGDTECLVKIYDNWFIVKRAVGWTESHNHPIGQVVHVFNQHTVVAASDGYIGLLQWNFAPPHVVAELSSEPLERG
jgi:methionyl-tRNA formyltransferase